MQTSFAEVLRKIKHDNDMIRQETETRMKLADTEYQSAQQSMLTEFKAIDTKYTTVLESFSSLRTDLRNEQSVQDRRHMGMKQSLGAMMHILLNISQSLSAGTRPDPLLQEQIENLMQWIQEPNRDGAPGIDNTERSSADLQGGGRKE